MSVHKIVAAQSVGSSLLVAKGGAAADDKRDLDEDTEVARRQHSQQQELYTLINDPLLLNGESVDKDETNQATDGDPVN